MSLEPISTRGLCLTGSIAALRRTLYLISAGFSNLPALLPTRSLSPPTADRVGFQYFKGYIAGIPKLLLVDPFWFSRVWFALVHSISSFVASLNSLVGFKDNKGKFGNVKITFGGVKNVL
jgi:hypothetical protein